MGVFPGWLKGASWKVLRHRGGCRNYTAACQATIGHIGRQRNSSQMIEGCSCILQRVLEKIRTAMLHQGNSCPRAKHFSNSLMWLIGKGSLQRIIHRFSAKFRKLSAEFQHFPGAKTVLLQISANFPQSFCKTFRKKPFANDPISELLRIVTPYLKYSWNDLQVTA